MREIKFRQYFEGHDDANPEWNYFNLRNGKMVVDDGWKDPQQFTGLLDKNGVEIYEGDLVEVKQGRYTWRYKIVFNNYFMELEAKTFWRNFYYDHDPDIDDYRWGDTFDSKGGCKLPNTAKGEVIGNIYENPELLDK